MRKIIVTTFILLMAGAAFAGGRPVQIIRCVDRGLEDSDALAKTSVLKAAVGDTTNRLCYPGLLAITVPDLCIGDASTLHTITIKGDTLLPGDAVTVNSFTNMILTEDPYDLVNTVDRGAGLRSSFTAIPDPADPTKGIIEIEFTRDPFSPSLIQFGTNTTTASNDGMFPIALCTTVAPIATVPTMGQWGLISLGLILMIFAISAVRSRMATPTIA